MSKEDWRLIVELWPVLGVIATLIIGGMLLYLATKFMPRSACKACREEVETRQQEMETVLQDTAQQQQAFAARMQDLPTRQDIHNLGLELSGVKGEMSRMNESIKSVQQQQNFLRSDFTDMLRAHIIQPH